MVKRKYIDNTQTESGDADGNGSKNEQSDVDVKEETLEVHHVPFKIEFEGQANVDVKFTGKSVPSSSDPKVLSNQFRGRPLQGQKLDLPKEYEGLVATDLRKSSGADEENDEETEISLGKRFESMTYWNWDRTPSGMDKHVKLVDWLEVAQILHAPVGEV